MAAKRSIVVYGAGAVGGYLGAKLSLVTSVDHHPYGVTLVGRVPIVEAARTRGITLHEGDSTVIAHPQAVTEAANLSPCDLVILTVRAYDLQPALSDVRRLMGDHGWLLAMQNGVGSEDELAVALGRKRLLAGTLTVSLAMETPGMIDAIGHARGMALASMDGSAVPDWIAQALRACGLPTRVVEDYRALRWSKLLLNMLTAASSAILDEDPATIAADPSLFRMEQLAFREAGRVMDAERVATLSLPGYPVPLARLAMRLPRPLAQRVVARRIAGARGGRSPGMRSDVMRGKSDVAYYNGAVAQTGRRLRIRTPVNAALAEILEDLLAHPERREAFRGRPEALINALRERGIKV